MNLTKTTLSLVATASLVVFSSGCGSTSKPKPKKYVKHRVVKDQKLFLSTAINSIAKDNQSMYEINLDNYENAQATITLKNLGDKPLHINSVNLKDPSGLLKVSSSCTQALSANETCQVKLNFKTENAGEYISYLEIISNDVKHPKSKIAVNMKAKNNFHAQVSSVKASKLDIQTPVKLKFNAGSKVRYVEIKNDGLKPITLSAPLKAGPDARNFTYKTDCQSSLASGEKCKVAITYNPLKKDGFSDASLILPSNAKITPSNSVRLEGYSKPFSLSIKKFVVAKNIDNFTEDYFKSNKTYYIRTIYQNNVGRFFESGIKKEIKKYFKVNNFNMASTAEKADKIITVYPSVQVAKNSKTNDVEYNIVINGFVTTKSKNLAISKNTKELILDQNSTQSGLEFTVSKLTNTIFAKEHFQFGLTVQIDNIADEREVELTIADILVSKLFNTLGLRDTKGNN